MDKDMSKIEKIKKSLDEMEAQLSESGLHRTDEKIHQAAQKGHVILDRAEHGAHNLAHKMKEKRDMYRNMDEKKKDKMWDIFIATMVTLIAIMAFKKIRNKRDKD